MAQTSTGAGVQKKYRNPVAIIFLPCITLGVYCIVWYVKTKEEMKTEGADIPTA